MNAIVLAAGLGSRFGSMTKETSKTLLDVNGLPGLEHTLRFLQRNDITDITIVTGYQAERFAYLPEKYGVELIHNPYYAVYNNRYSFACAAERFGDSLVIDGDVVVLDDILVPMTCSTYYLIQREEEGAEWVPRTDASGRVIAMDVTAEHAPSLLGVSYWTAAAARRICEVLPTYMTEEELLNPKAYWDDIPTHLYSETEVRTVVVASDAAREMDTQAQYAGLCAWAAKK